MKLYEIEQKIVLLEKVKKIYSEKEIKEKEIYQIKSNNNIIYLRKETSDFNVLKCIFKNKEYDINYRIEKPKIILDCGANIGIGSLFFNMKFPEAKIIALEPEESNYELLCKNVENLNNIIPVNAGLWKKECKLKIRDIGLDKWGFIVEETEEENGIKAECIDSLIKKFNIKFIDILKIDIEGSEKEIFESSCEWLEKVGVLVIELHDRMKKGCSMSLFKKLYDYEYDLEISGENLVFYFSREQRAESREQRAESREQRAVNFNIFKSNYKVEKINVTTQL